MLTCALGLRIAHGTERVGDATYVYELQQHARGVTAFESEFLALIEIAPEDERFNLYWTYNHLTGAWVQVEYLRTLLDLSIASAAPADEEKIRATLRDQAQFVLWELDQDNIDLEQNLSEGKRPDHLRVNVAVRSLLWAIRNTVSRLLVDQCAYGACAT